MESKQLSPRARLAFGLAIAAGGVALAGFGLLQALSDASSDRWIAAPCGIVFACGGVLVAFPAMNETLRTLLFAMLLSAFGVIFTWIGLGPGERHFSSSAGIGRFGISGTGDVTAGRVFFGAFGLLFDLIALAVWWKTLKLFFRNNSAGSGT